MFFTLQVNRKLVLTPRAGERDSFLDDGHGEVSGSRRDGGVGVGGGGGSSQAKVGLEQPLPEEPGAERPDVGVLEARVAEAVDQRIQQAVHVGQDHQAVVGLHRYVLRPLPILQPHAQQHRPGDGARQEADGEDHHHRHDHTRGPPKLGLLAHRLLAQPVDDAHGAVDQDDERDDDLAEEDQLGERERGGGGGGGFSEVIRAANKQMALMY